MPSTNMGSDPSRSSRGPGGPWPRSFLGRAGGGHGRHHLVGGAERQPGDGAVDVAHDARGVDDDDRAPVEADRAQDPVLLAHLLVLVRQQREGEAALLVREAVVALDRLRADGQHHRLDLTELVDLGRVAVELAGAHRRVVARVERQHHRLAGPLGQRVVPVAFRRAVGAGQREIGGLVPHLGPTHLRACGPPVSDRRTAASNTLCLWFTRLRSLTIQPASTVSRIWSGMSKLACTACTSSWSSRASISRSTLLAASAVSSATVVDATIVRSDESTGISAASRAVRTACRSVGGVVTRQLSPSSTMSSAPASRAVSISSSSSTERGTMIWPVRANCQATAPGSEIDPPFLVKMFRTAAPVRLRLSVSTSTMTATEPGA